MTEEGNLGWIITTIATIMAVAVLTPEAVIRVTTHEGQAGPHKTESTAATTTERERTKQEKDVKGMSATVKTTSSQNKATQTFF